MAELTLTGQNFEQEVLLAKEPVLVDFWATWCGPCMMLSPIMEELDGEMPDVKFCKLNVDDASDIAGRYGVMSIPTVIVFKNGKPVAQQVGAVGKGVYAAMLDKAL